MPPKHPQVNTNKPGPRSWLASTGASVLGIVAVAALLIAVGVLLVRRRK
ncbi:LPXTG cell wall anchor domain-containing protein [Corynebacterium diphtheriae]|nr:LPXTG cell wall anchor domain-containing protein [Corynebacterium diphtheriae]